MNSSEIEKNLVNLLDNFDSNEFIYDFLLAYGISKTSITRLKKGDFNLSKVEGEVLYKNKVFFKIEKTDKLLFEVEESAKNEKILKHNPRFVIVTDFQTIVAKDLKTKLNRDFKITELPKYVDFFLPLTGAEIYKSSNDNKADRDAAYKLAQLYDILVTDNPEIYKEGSHKLNVFLSRLLFCFFAEDTGIFEKESVFTETLSQHTVEDGNNVHEYLNQLFQRLNSKEGNFPAYLEQFPYVNGGLFRDSILSPKFSARSRKILIECGDLDWSEINPDIFGSMIQAVADPEERSDLGMHYTSVPNIKKLIEPLFLDELYEDFQKNYDNANNLKKLINRIAKIKFFDPACGSGNFLIIAYKEIRLLEIKIIQRLVDIEKTGGLITLFFTSISLSQFYGIEIKDFAHEMAILSLWLAEHQMNKVFETELEDYGRSKPILPLKEAGKIVCANAARANWENVCSKNPEDEIYILGNPPYLGSRKQKLDQKNDLKFVFFNKFKKFKDLDYISIWIYKCALFIRNFNCKSGFVSTNSICQGEQVSLIWPHIFNLGIKINFAYSSFKWNNNAKGNAGVTVIIIGLCNDNTQQAILFDDKFKREVDSINAYLIPSHKNLFIIPKTKSISHLPTINHGNMPADGGKLLFTTSEKNEFILKQPDAEKWFRKLITVKEHLNGRDRWCLWLEGISEDEINKMPEIKKVIEEVRLIREKSSRPQLARTPHLFAQITQPDDKNCLIIPRVSSENRHYLPIDLFDGSSYKVTDSYFTIATNEPYLFGVISSRMHMIWMKSIGGKLETRIQYSKNVIYNTFPFPEINVKQKETINQYVFQVLDERAKYPEKTMAWLYSHETMPKGLKQTHKELDEAIERIYRLNPFQNDAERLEYLFKLYEEMTRRDTLFAKQKKTRIKATKQGE